MAEKEKSQSLSTEQLVYANMVSIESLVNVLINKGICTKDDILSSLKEVQKKQDEFVLNLINQSKKQGE